MRLDRVAAPASGKELRMRVRRTFEEWFGLSAFWFVTLFLSIASTISALEGGWLLAVFAIALAGFMAQPIVAILMRRSGWCELGRNGDDWHVVTKRWFGRRRVETFGTVEVVASRVVRDRWTIPVRLRCEGRANHVLLTLRSGREVHVAEGFGRLDEELATLRTWFEAPSP